MERMMITVIVEMRANPTRGLFRKSQEAMILARVQRKRNVATNQGQAKPINQNKSPVLWIATVTFAFPAIFQVAKPHKAKADSVTNVAERMAKISNENGSSPFIF
jgi:hypothetical protein